MSVCDIDFGLELKKAYEHGYADGKRDAVPVVHGQWEGWHGNFMRRDGKYQHYHYYECSLCCRLTAVRSNYCPNCGAKMDGGENNDVKHAR